MKNTVYKTTEIAKFFQSNRIKWDDFYPSEKTVILQLQLNSKSRVLDLGCGCAGLGRALREKFSLIKYYGVEINSAAASIAKSIYSNESIFEGDMLEVLTTKMVDEKFDVVFSLSCIDWNNEFLPMFNLAWEKVSPGGFMVATFRCVLDSKTDLMREFQYINYSGKLEGEVAPYIVLNVKYLFDKIYCLDPSQVIADGYWGPPSITAVTGFQSICFLTVAIQKRLNSFDLAIQKKYTLPKDILECIG
jgi:SAM-dependent methyltransferase